MSHSIPMFDGAEQKPGEEYAGTFAFENGCMTMEISKAYGLDALHSCERRIVFDTDGITLTDRFDYEGKTITERFVTKRKPTVENGEILIGKTRLTFDPAYAPTVKTETHFLHGYSGESIPVYCIDFDLPGAAKEFSIRIEAK